MPSSPFTSPSRRDEASVDPKALMAIRNLELRARVVVEGFWTGLHRSPYHGFSVEFTEYRQYTPGDDTRYLDWRLFARSDRFYLKKFEDETNLRCHLLVDQSRSMEYGSLGYSKSDYARTLAATLGWFLNGQGDAVGLFTFDAQVREYLPARHRHGHMRQLMLALEKRGGGGSETNLNAPLRRMSELIRKRGLVVLVSDLLASIFDLETSLGRLTAAGHEVVIFQVLDPNELKFDFHNAMLFQDVESERDLYLDPEAVRAEYQRKLAKHSEDVEKICRRLGISFHRVTTDRPLELNLSDFLRSRGAGGKLFAVGRSKELERERLSKLQGPRSKLQRSFKLRAPIAERGSFGVWSLEFLWSLELGIWSFWKMNFLSPWFLLGGVAIAGPILFHLIRRAARERVSFSSLMFLRPTAPRVTRRRRLEHFWLLLLRCLALLLLATGFARPFFSKDITSPTPPGEARQIVLLVDTSASMKREGLWSKAVALAQSHLDKATPSDQFALVTFDRQPHTLVGFGEWSSWAPDQRAGLARQRLAAVNPGWMNTQLGLALTSAAEQMMNDSATAKPAPRREVILISDMQEGAKLDGLQGHDWPTGVKVSVERVEPSRKNNAGLEILAVPNAKTGGDDTIHVRVANSRDSNREKFQIAWASENGGSSEPMEIYLPPGQARSFTAPKKPNASTQLKLSGDEESFDNASYYTAPEFERTSIAWFGKESVNDPEKLRYYIERVFPEAPRQPIQIVRPYTNSAFSLEMLNRSAFAVIADTLTPEEIAPVRDWLTRGKSALLVLIDSQMAPTLSAIAGLPEMQMTEVTNNFALLGEVDFSHPLFAPFADPRFSDFTHIHFWKHRRWEIPAGARALAKFDDGSPALVQLTVGKGNLLVLSSGWNPSDSQFAVSSKFPPLMQRMLDWSGADSPTRFQFLTGDAIPGSAGVSPAGSTPSPLPQVEWQKPDGKKITLNADAPFTETDIPGIYTATIAGKQRHYAVNLSLDESRTAALAPDELARLGVPLQLGPEISVAQLQVQQRYLQQAELENRQKLWRWLIAGVLAITLGEIILGGWLARRVKTVEVVA